MRAWIFSDLHFEYGAREFVHDIPKADICICAGDVMDGGPSSSIKWLGDWVSHLMPVVIVPGDTEYARSSLVEGSEAAEDVAANYPNLHFLNNGVVSIDGVRFIGSTLWTDFAIYGSPRDGMLDAKRTSRNFDLIKTSRVPRKRFSAPQSLKRHRKACAFLEQNLPKAPEFTTIVITHHAPSLHSLSDDWLDVDLAPSYASNLDRLILCHQPFAWIHGHVHRACDYYVGDTRVICNPRGLPGEGARFKPDLTVDIPRVGNWKTQPKVRDAAFNSTLDEQLRSRGVEAAT